MNVALHPLVKQSTFRTAYSKSWSTTQAVARCVHTIGPTQPNLLIIFCGGKHEPDVVLHDFRKAYPTVPIVGGSAAGVISRDGAGYSGLEIGALAVFGSGAAPAVVTVDGLGFGEHAAGVTLGRKIAAVADDDAPVLLFYDSVAACDPPQLHPAATLVAGVEEGLAGRRVRLVGGGLLTDVSLTDGWVFDGREARKHAAVALVFPSTLTFETSVVHGCRPVSTFMTITRAEGAEILELDGKPALEVIEALSGLSAERNLALNATLGVKLGDPYEPFLERSYVNRLILNADRARGSVTLFEPDLSAGTRVQVMMRDSDLILASARRGVAEMNEVIAAEHDRVAFSFYIDCAGRASAVSGTPQEEADVIRQGLIRVPFLGFYSGVEIAPFGGRARSLDWSGVLVTARYR
jgi:hypothetical protein